MPKPKPALPNPAAALPGEADILATVLADLSDDTAKLVYADWLEDRDDPRGPLLRRFVTAFRAGTKLPAVTSAPQPWRELVGLTLVAKLRGTTLESHANQLLALARPTLAFKSAKAAEKTLPVGASKFGGRPDLPPGTEWPEFRGGPIAFLGQFNLGDLHTSPVCRELPDRGVFSLFCVYEEDGGDDEYEKEKGSWRLFYFPDVSKLVRHELDAGLWNGARFPSCRLEFAETLTLPPQDSPWKHELKFGKDHAADDAYRELLWDMGAGDRLLGYPSPISSQVLGAKSVRHLLSLNGNNDTGWVWGDDWSLYFTIKEDDLRDARFDRVRMRVLSD